jgi:C-terminal processing protease CtpA/Prc
MGPCRLTSRTPSVEVSAESAADRAGLSAGDIMTTVNRRAVHDGVLATRELARTEAGQPVFVLVWRRGVETVPPDAEKLIAKARSRRLDQLRRYR